MMVKLDENLGRRCAELFRKAGHDVQTVPEEGLCSASDRLLIDRSKAEGRCMVSLELDFANPLVFRPSEFRGIAVLRLPHRPTHADLRAAVGTLCDGLGREAIDGKLWVVRKGRIREFRERGGERRE